MTPGHPFLDHPGPIAFAHRGGAEAQPENTMAAFASAVALGYEYLETDVHLTADGVLIAFHDDRLDRVTDGRGVVAELPWSTVRQARVAGREPIVEMAELLAAFPEARLNIEPKHDAAVPALVATIQDANALDRVCVGSFSDRRIAAVRAGLGPGGCTSLGPGEIAALRLASWGVPGMANALRRRPGRCVQVPLRSSLVPLVDARLLATAHELGLPVHAWTVNDPGEMQRLLDLGIDGLMTDRPALLREVLVARGAWHGAQHDPSGARHDASRARRDASRG
ncbi:MAG: glycerophosphodiester phosphodiesterase [Candidatus Limnocylindrales bacterium]